VNETFAGRPKQFLADLTQAMRSAAEAGRTTIIEQARSNAESYVEGLRGEATTQQTALREAAADDVTQLRDQAKAQAQLVRDASERRVQERRQLVDDAIAEYGRAVEAELKRVEESIAAWEQELDRFYGQLADETDPTMFASLASTMPNPPEFGTADPADLIRRLQSPEASAAQSAGQLAAVGASKSDATAAESNSEALADHWWLDSRYARR